MNYFDYTEWDKAKMDIRTIEHIQKEYLKDDIPWCLGFSGGKDSSALLKLSYIALHNLKKRHKAINAVYCDSGVEIPLIAEYVEKTLNGLNIECCENNIPIQTFISKPKLEDRYFCKVIGRGYPPPSNKFRWCTERLRVKPIQNILINGKEKGIVLVGIRLGESVQRDRVLSKYVTENEYYFKQSNNSKVILYSPIVNYNVDDVWSTLLEMDLPRSLDGKKLRNFYKIISSQQKLDEDVKKLGEIKGRIGCWTCTVVRKDKAVENLIAYGFTELKPLLEFRNWLYVNRNNPDYRCSRRRNGNKGFGPFKLAAREIILGNLLMAQSHTRFELISDEEINYIFTQWELDKNSNNYCEK